MTCLTSFSSKKIWLAIVLLAMPTMGCSNLDQRPPLGKNSFLIGSEHIRPDGLPSISKSSIAVLPVENLSGVRAPLQRIGKMMTSGLENRGFNLLNEERLEKFRKKHRMRYIGGMSTKLALSIRDETGVDACLLTSLEAYREKYPPQLALISRLVLSGREPVIVWINSVGITGEDAPGLLGLGRVKKPEKLMARAIDQLLNSLSARLEILQEYDQRPETFSQTTSGRGVSRRYLPKDFFRSPMIEPGKTYRVAVIPFLDLAMRKNAGRIMALHFVKELHRRPNIVIMEPGMVREELLRFRAVMEAGPSLAISDLISSEHSLDVDLVVSGKVFDYQGETGTAKVDFSVQAFEKHSREVIYTSKTYCSGDQGVFFFNVGRVRSAHNLTEEMTRAAVNLMIQ